MKRIRGFSLFCLPFFLTSLYGRQELFALDVAKEIEERIERQFASKEEGKSLGMQANKQIQEVLHHL